jgi:ribose transport system permease protein
LLLAGAPQWAPQLFQGVILVFAVGLTVFRVRFPKRSRAA